MSLTQTIKARRGSQASVISGLGAVGELLYTTDTKKLYISNGPSLLPSIVSGVIYDTIANRPAAGFVGRLFYASDTHRRYVDTGSVWQDSIAQRFVFVQNPADVTTNNNTTFVSVARMIFPGTSVYTPDTIKVMLARTAGTGLIQFQVVDVTNASAVIVSGSNINSAYPSITTVTGFNNLSASDAIWEMQIARQGATAATATYYGASVT